MRRAQGRQLARALRRATHRLPLLRKEVRHHESRRHVHLIRQTQRRGDRGAGHQPAMAASVLGGDGRAARPARSTSVRMAHSSRGTDLHDGPRRLAARRGRPPWETLGSHLVAGCWTNRHVERGNEAYYFGSRRTNEERPESFPTVPYSLRNSHWKAVSTFRPFAGSPRPEPEPHAVLIDDKKISEDDLDAAVEEQLESYNNSAYKACSGQNRPLSWRLSVYIGRPPA